MHSNFVIEEDLSKNKRKCRSEFSVGATCKLILLTHIHTRKHTIHQLSLSALETNNIMGQPLCLT